MVSLSECEDVFWAELMSVLGYDVSAARPGVRHSWPTEGQPDWKIDEDVLFLQVLDDAGDDITQPLDDEWVDAGEDLTLVQGQTRVLKLNLIAYGPNSYDHLVTIRHAFMHGRENFAKNNIYIVPSSDTPQRAPELFQGRWWERADLSLRFNNLLSFTTSVNAIKEVDVNVDVNKPGCSEEVISSEFGISLISNK